jgi:hypothetical protein
MGLEVLTEISLGNIEGRELLGNLGYTGGEY